MYIFDRSREIVGYSVWPWDSIYTPVVGCFRDGRLVQTSACDLLPQQGMGGPRHAWWFRMRVDPDTRFRLESGDPSVRLMRLEDGAAVPAAFAVETEPHPLRRVEELVAHVAAVDVLPLVGFTGFVAAPVTHQLAVLYLDVLGRRVDEGGIASYLPRMELGMTIFQVRDEMMRSEEFRNREITVSSRVGSLVTSPIWNELRKAEPLGEWRRPLSKVRVSAYRDLDDDAFVRALHRDTHGHEADEAAVEWLLEGALDHGRDWIASVLVRDAAQGGVYTDFATH